jgi:RNA polymerase primary sigma factor
MYRIDPRLNEIIAKGQAKGHVLFEEVCQYLPDEGENAEKIDSLLLCLDEFDIDIRQVGDFVTRTPPKTTLSTGDSASVAAQRRLLEDPIRSYLTEMAEIPMLSREDEIRLAKIIEITRKRYRRRLLECDYVMNAVIDILDRVQSEQLPFDRTLEVSVSEDRQKHQIIGRMPRNLKTLQRLQNENIDDFAIITAKRSSVRSRKRAQAALTKRRRKMVTLVEELGIRTHKLEVMYRKLEEISRVMDALKAEIEELRRRAG